MELCEVFMNMPKQFLFSNGKYFTPLLSVTAHESFVELSDAAGNLTFLSGETRLAAVKGCEVVEVSIGKSYIS